MSTEFLSKSYTPVSKRAYATNATTTLTIWTPANGKRIGLTDIEFSGDALAGTLRIYFDDTFLKEYKIYSSAIIDCHYQTPILSDVNNTSLKIVGSVAGFLAVNVNGFEMD